MTIYGDMISMLLIITVVIVVVVVVRQTVCASH